MAIAMIGHKILMTNGKMAHVPLPLEDPAIFMLRDFITGVLAFMADWDRLPTTQAELEDYVLLGPTEYYTFVFYSVDTSLCYFNATSSYPLIHSYTRTISWSGGLFNYITCKKLGITPPGCADYNGGVLSCQIGTEEV